jgi:CheY-like chemotaxis protein
MIQPSVNFHDQKILIVESHTRMRKLVCEMLHGFGVRHIREARNAHDAATCLHSEHFDALVIDLSLDDMDGAEFARSIRRNEKCRNQRIPILMTTAKTDKDSVMKLRNSGVHEVLAKPMAANDMYLRLYTMLAYPRPFVVSESYVGPGRRRSIDSKANSAAKPGRRTAFAAQKSSIRNHMPMNDIMFA